MTVSNPVTMLVSYYPKPGSEDELLGLIHKHWPTLDRLGLVSQQAPQVWRARDKRTDRTFFVEMFQWKDGQASDVAHQSPEVMAIWEPMGPILENLTLTQIEPIPTRLGRR
jgi:hypothetical protein